MWERYRKLVGVGAAVLALKVLLVAVVLLAMYSNGISRLQTLWLGADVLPVNETIRDQFGVSSRGGVLLNLVREHSPAESAGLRRGDVILNVDSRPIYGANDIRRVLQDRHYNDSVRIVYLRDGTVFSTKTRLDYRTRSASAGNVRSVYRYELTPTDFLSLLVLGLFAGALSGMIGCGGGVLKVSVLMIFFGFEIFLAKVVSLVSCGFMSLSASYHYIRRDLVDRRALVYLIPSGIIGVVCGVLVSMLLTRHVLEITLGVFLVYAALDVAYQIYTSVRAMRGGDGSQAPNANGRQRDPSILVFVGFPTGAVSAILGITGGVIATPLHRLLTRAPVKTCIANTLVTVVFVSFLGGSVLLVEGLVRGHFSLGTFSKVLLAVAPGSILGGQLGAVLHKELPVDCVRAIYVVALLAIAYKILLAA